MELKKQNLGNVIVFHFSRTPGSTTVEFLCKEFFPRQKAMLWDPKRPICKAHRKWPESRRLFCQISTLAPEGKFPSFPEVETTRSHPQPCAMHSSPSPSSSVTAEAWLRVLAWSRSQLKETASVSQEAAGKGTSVRGLVGISHPKELIHTERAPLSSLAIHSNVSPGMTTKGHVLFLSHLSISELQFQVPRNLNGNILKF